MGQVSSYSALTLHRRCPQAHYYRYGLHLRKAGGTPAALAMGSWWHAMRAAIRLEQGREESTLKELPEEVRTVDDGPIFDPRTVTPTEVYRAAETWWDQLDGQTRETWVEKYGSPMPHGLDNMRHRWLSRWADDILHEQVLAVEMRWERKLPGTDATLVGYIDEIYYDTRRELLVVRDAKTAEKLDQTSADDLMDSQLALYAWGAAPTVRSWDLGTGIKALSYDRIRSVTPRPPTLTKSGRLSVRKGEPTLGMCDLDTYLDWSKDGVPFEGTKKDGSGAGLYEAEDSVIEKLSTLTAREVWQRRTLTPLNVNVVRSHLQSAVDSVKDISRSQARIERTGEAARNLTSMCRACDYVKLCRAQMIGGPDGEYAPEDYGLVMT